MFTDPLLKHFHRDASYRQTECAFNKTTLTSCEHFANLSFKILLRTDIFLILRWISASSLTQSVIMRPRYLKLETYCNDFPQAWLISVCKPNTVNKKDNLGKWELANLRPVNMINRSSTSSMKVQHNTSVGQILRHFEHNNGDRWGDENIQNKILKILPQGVVFPKTRKNC